VRVRILGRFQFTVTPGVLLFYGMEVIINALSERRINPFHFTNLIDRGVFHPSDTTKVAQQISTPL
jgi:hypothetical protein